MAHFEEKFWGILKSLTMADRSVAAPESAVAKAVALFQGDEKPGFVFKMRPVFAGAVRKAAPTPKYFFELDDETMVQLEVAYDEASIHLSGTAHGLEDGPVTLYGSEQVWETAIEAGKFEFKCLVAGTYSLSFIQGEEDYWIASLKIEEEKS